MSASSSQQVAAATTVTDPQVITVLKSKVGRPPKKKPKFGQLAVSRFFCFNELRFVFPMEIITFGMS